MEAYCFFNKDRTFSNVQASTQPSHSILGIASEFCLVRWNIQSRMWERERPFSSRQALGSQEWHPIPGQEGGVGGGVGIAQALTSMPVVSDAKEASQHRAQREHPPLATSGMASHTLWPWACHLTSLGFIFLVVKTEVSELSKENGEKGTGQVKFKKRHPWGHPTLCPRVWPPPISWLSWPF